MSEPVTITKLLRSRRWCYWIPADGYVEGHGFRVSVVFEHEPGHHPTGDDDWMIDAFKRKPWFWGHDYGEAKKVAEELNRDKLGLSAEDAASIVASSMAAEGSRP